MEALFLLENTEFTEIGEKNMKWFHSLALATNGYGVSGEMTGIFMVRHAFIGVI